MDLWVRSQDKMGNFKSNSQVIRKIGHKDKSEEFVVLNNNNMSELLGTYKTKKRALEVLDEIQNVIYMNKLFNANPKSFKLLLEVDYNMSESEINKLLKDISVYEMPKE